VPTPPGGSGSLTGKVIVVDPGHNGQNYNHPEIINQLVPAGFGQTKPCNTTGTQTNAGYSEHAFNWAVGVALAGLLRAKGATVIMTRSSDDGVGPCVNKRAAIGNNAHADAVVSIHGDGESAGMAGFYVMTAAQDPAGTAMATRSLTLAKAIRNGLEGAGFPPSNGLGSDGLWKRDDLAGLNLSVRPTVMIECGNMRNAHEAAVMSSTAGQKEYAAGIAAGVLAYLAG
jgi:N-acetylmuramoyl-L-alanine amidase